MSKSKSGLRTEAWSHNTACRFTCGLCGGSTEKLLASVKLVDGDGETITSDVCTECVAAGPVGAAARMRQKVKELREYAEDLEALVPEVERISPENWATLDDLRAADQASLQDDDEPGDQDMIEQELEDVTSF